MRQAPPSDDGPGQFGEPGAHREGRRERRLRGGKELAGDAQAAAAEGGASFEGGKVGAIVADHDRQPSRKRREAHEPAHRVTLGRRVAEDFDDLPARLQFQLPIAPADIMFKPPFKFRAEVLCEAVMHGDGAALVLDQQAGVVVQQARDVLADARIEPLGAGVDFLRGIEAEFGAVDARGGAAERGEAHVEIGDAAAADQRHGAGERRRHPRKHARQRGRRRGGVGSRGDFDQSAVEVEEKRDAARVPQGRLQGAPRHLEFQASRPFPQKSRTRRGAATMKLSEFRRLLAQKSSGAGGSLVPGGLGRAPLSARDRRRERQRRGGVNWLSFGAPGRRLRPGRSSRGDGRGAHLAGTRTLRGSTNRGGASFG